MMTLIIVHCTLAVPAAAAAAGIAFVAYRHPDRTPRVNAAGGPSLAEELFGPR
jgi:ABC-type enterobactin transport system permease subunit